jgi:hypothetical protein
MIAISSMATGGMPPWTAEWCPNEHTRCGKLERGPILGKMADRASSRCVKPTMTSSGAQRAGAVPMERFHGCRIGTLSFPQRQQQSKDSGLSPPGAGAVFLNCCARAPWAVKYKGRDIGVAVCMWPAPEDRGAGGIVMYVEKIQKALTEMSNCRSGSVDVRSEIIRHD